MARHLATGAWLVAVLVVIALLLGGTIVTPVLGQDAGVGEAGLILCGAISAPSKGGLGTCSSSLFGPTTCSISCSDGYAPSPARTICNAAGVITTTQTCVVACDTRIIAHTVPNDANPCPTWLATQTNCQIGCEAGYSIAANPTITSCLGSTLSPQSCQPLPCPTVTSEPPDGHLGNCSTEIPMVTAQFCNFDCPSGYHLTGPTTCGSIGGSQVTTLGYCDGNSCSVPLEAIQAAPGYQGTTCSSVLAHDDTCRISCLDGYVAPPDSTPIGCWAGDLTGPQACIPLDCILPGGASGNCPETMPHDTTCNICANGFISTDATLTECKAGAFTHTQTCIPAPCVVPTALHSSSACTTLASGASCPDITCAAGYQPAGTPNSCFQGTLSSPAQSCVPAPPLPVLTLLPSQAQGSDLFCGYSMSIGFMYSGSGPVTITISITGGVFEGGSTMQVIPTDYPIYISTPSDCASTTSLGGDSITISAIPADSTFTIANPTISVLRRALHPIFDPAPPTTMVLGSTWTGTMTLVPAPPSGMTIPLSVSSGVNALLPFGSGLSSQDLIITAPSTMTTSFLVTLNSDSVLWAPFPDLAIMLTPPVLTIGYGLANGGTIICGQYGSLNFVFSSPPADNVVLSLTITGGLFDDATYVELTGPGDSWYSMSQSYTTADSCRTSTSVSGDPLTITATSADTSKFTIANPTISLVAVPLRATWDSAPPTTMYFGSHWTGTLSVSPTPASEMSITLYPMSSYVTNNLSPFDSTRTSQSITINAPTTGSTILVKLESPSLTWTPIVITISLTTPPPLVMTLSYGLPSGADLICGQTMDISFGFNRAPPDGLVITMVGALFSSGNTAAVVSGLGATWTSAYLTVVTPSDCSTSTSADGTPLTIQALADTSKFTVSNPSLSLTIRAIRASFSSPPPSFMALGESWTGTMSVTPLPPVGVSITIAVMLPYFAGFEQDFSNSVPSQSITINAPLSMDGGNPITIQLVSIAPAWATENIGIGLTVPALPVLTLTADVLSGSDFLCGQSKSIGLLFDRQPLGSFDVNLNIVGGLFGNGLTSMSVSISRDTWQGLSVTIQTDSDCLTATPTWGAAITVQASGNTNLFTVGSNYLLNRKVLTPTFSDLPTTLPLGGTWFCFMTVPIAVAGTPTISVSFRPILYIDSLSMSPFTSDLTTQGFQITAPSTMPPGGSTVTISLESDSTAWATYAFSFELFAPIPVLTFQYGVPLNGDIVCGQSFPINFSFDIAPTQSLGISFTISGALFANGLITDTITLDPTAYASQSVVIMTQTAADDCRSSTPSPDGVSVNIYGQGDTSKVTVSNPSFSWVRKILRPSFDPALPSSLELGQVWSVTMTLPPIPSAMPGMAAISIAFSPAPDFVSAMSPFTTAMFSQDLIITAPVSMPPGNSITISLTSDSPAWAPYSFLVGFTLPSPPTFTLDPSVSPTDVIDLLDGATKSFHLHMPSTPLAVSVQVVAVNCLLNVATLTGPASTTMTWPFVVSPILPLAVGITNASVSFIYTWDGNQVFTGPYTINLRFTQSPPAVQYSSSSTAVAASSSTSNAASSFSSSSTGAAASGSNPGNSGSSGSSSNSDSSGSSGSSGSSSVSTSSTGVALVPAKIIANPSDAINEISPPFSVSTAEKNPCDLRPGFCGNHGQCVSSRVGTAAGNSQQVQLSCVCPKAFFGPHCEVAILACTSGCASSMGGNATLQLIGVGFEYIRDLKLAGVTLPYGVGDSLPNTHSLVTSEITTKKNGGPWEDYVLTDHNSFGVISFKSLPFSALPASTSSQVRMIDGGYVVLSLDSFTSSAHESPMFASTAPAPSYQSLVARAQFPTDDVGVGSIPIEIPYTVAPVYYAVSNCGVGQFQNSIGDCTACPDGCTCPGAGRCWPQPGYWSYSQSSMPIKCSVPENCPGVPVGSSSVFATADSPSVGAGALDTQQCALGYTGVGCVSCADKYYQLNARCYSCGSTDQTGEMVSILIAAAAVTLGLAIGVATLSATHLVYVVTVFVVLQQLAATGQQGAQNVPGVVGRGLATFFSWISVVNFDLQILRPGCSVPSFTFLILFWATVGLVGISAILFLAACLVRFLVRHLAERTGRGITPEAQAAKTRAALAAAKKDLTAAACSDGLFHTPPLEDFKRRLAHANLVLATVFYLKLSTLMIRVFQCSLAPNPQSTYAATPGDESYYLTADLQTRCYEGAHLATIILVAFFFVTYSLLFPIATFVVLCRAFADEKTTGAIGALCKRFKILRPTQTKREEHKAAYKQLSAEEKQHTDVVAAAVAAGTATAAVAAGTATAAQDKYAATKSTSEGEMVDPALTSLYIENRRIATYAYLFLGIRHATFPYRLSLFVTMFAFACITTLTSSNITQLFLLGLCFAIDALIVCWYLPFHEWYDNARGAIVALAALGHSVLMIGIQSDATHAPLFFVSLAMFVSLCVVLALRTKLLALIHRLTGTTGAKVNPKTGEIESGASDNAVTAFTPEDGERSENEMDFSITGEAPSARERRLARNQDSASRSLTPSLSSFENEEDDEDSTASAELTKPKIVVPALTLSKLEQLQATSSDSPIRERGRSDAATEKQGEGSFFEQSAQLSSDSTDALSPMSAAQPPSVRRATEVQPIESPLSSGRQLKPKLASIHPDPTSSLSSSPRLVRTTQLLPLTKVPSRRSSDVDTVLSSYPTPPKATAGLIASTSSASERSQSLQRALRSLSTGGELEPMGPMVSMSPTITTKHMRRISTVPTSLVRSPAGPTGLAAANAFLNRKASLSVAAVAPGSSVQLLLTQLQTAKAQAHAAAQVDSPSHSATSSSGPPPPRSELDE